MNMHKNIRIVVGGKELSKIHYKVGKIGVGNSFHTLETKQATILKFGEGAEQGYERSLQYCEWHGGGYCRMTNHNLSQNKSWRAPNQVIRQ